MFQMDLERAEEPEIKLTASVGKQESSRKKTSTSTLLAMPKPLTVWITINLENSERDESIRPPYLSHKEICMQVNSMQATVRTGHGPTDWFQIGKGVRQGCILSLCLFNLHAEYIM